MKFNKILALSCCLFFFLCFSGFSSPEISEGNATVAEDVDTSNNQKPDMGTDVYIYIPADPEVYPNLGAGFYLNINPVTYLLIAVVSGAAYIYIIEIDEVKSDEKEAN